MKKTLSLFLSLIILIGATAVPVIADTAENTVTAYVTVSKYGQIIDDKNGNAVAKTPVELSDEEIAERLKDFKPKTHDDIKRGFVRNFIDNITQADEGCDLTYMQYKN